MDASLTFDHGGENAAWFQVGYSCNDASGATITESPINGVHVEDGEVVHLVTIEPDDEDGPRWRRGTKNGTLKIWDPAFELRVTCEDGAGNSKTPIVVPEFRTGKG